LKTANDLDKKAKISAEKAKSYSKEASVKSK
jgi:hypothetical protein